MKENNKAINHTTNFLELLFLLFLGLKLGNVITWSWWWVFAPIWIPGVVVALCVLGATLYAVLEKKNEQNKK